MTDAALRKGWTLALLVGLGLVVAASLPPFVGEGVREHLMHAFATVCHQLPDRSPSVGGIPLAVCHRCYGIYWGIPIASFAYMALRSRGPIGRKIAPYVLFGSLIPIAIDWSGDVLGFWTNTPVSRMITGLIFGVVAGYFFVTAMVDAFPSNE